MASRVMVLPDERLLALRPGLLAGLRETAREVSGEAFDDFFDKAMRSLLIEGFERAGAHEGTIWLLDHESASLIPRFNSGPFANQFVGNFQQSLRAGMISMVVATEQPICENEVCKNQRQDRRLDERLHLRTWAMLAVPFYFTGELRGVISCVQLEPDGAAAPHPPGFTALDLRRLQLTVGVLSRLIEYRLLSLCLGLEGFG